MITELSQQQKDELKKVYDEYLNIGRDCTSINFEDAEQYISALYEWGGLKKPSFLYFSSPMICELFINLICWGQLVGQLRDQLRDQLGDQLVGQLGDQLRDQNLSYMGTWFCGQQDAYWVSYYTFCQKIGVIYKPHSSDGLEIWNEIVRSCHWFYPFLEFCLISDKPRKLNIDERGRLHSVAEKAVEYSDEWGFCSVHGVRVPNFIIESPEQITTKLIDDEQNAEVRRVMLEIFGVDNYLRGTVPIHQDRYGILYRKEYSDDTPLCMVRVLNSTPEKDGALTIQEAIGIFGSECVVNDSGLMRSLMDVVQDHPEYRFKEYFIGVPINMRTAHEAIAWTFYETPETYSPVVES